MAVRVAYLKYSLVPTFFFLSAHTFKSHNYLICPYLGMDFPTQFALCLTIAMDISIAFASLVVAISLIYIAGSYLGYPFGHLLLPYILQVMPDIRNIQSHDQQTPSQPLSIREHYRTSTEHELARGIGAILAYFFCFSALMIELYLEGHKDTTGEANGWDLWRMGEVLIRVCVEGLLILVFLRGFRYVGYLLLS